MSGTSKYQQVADWVRGRLEAGTLRPGDRLETETEIAQRFSYSRQTVRQALSKLEQEGVIEKIQGSGSYIRGQASGGRRDPLSHSVTIISSYTDSYIFPRILQSMATTLQKHGYATRIMFTSNRRETERRILSELDRQQVRDPLIVEPVASALPNPNLVYYQKLRERGIPVIFFNTFYPSLDIPHVSLMMWRLEKRQPTICSRWGTEKSAVSLKMMTAKDSAVTRGIRTRSSGPDSRSRRNMSAGWIPSC